MARLRQLGVVLTPAEVQDEGLDRVLDNIVGAGATAISPTLGAKVLFGALDEMATNWILSRRRYPLTADADAVVDLFLNGVTA